MMGEKARKGSHLTEDERNRIAMLLNEGWSPYKIGKELGRAANTIRNEIKRGTTTIFFKYFEKTGYFPDTGQAVELPALRSQPKSGQSLSLLPSFL